jgi:hypothetical protein
LRLKELNDYAIASILGNLKAESNLNPLCIKPPKGLKLDKTEDEYIALIKNCNYSDVIKDDVCFGLAQWHYSSHKNDLVAYCRAHGKSVSSIEGQLDFLIYQMSNGYKQTWQYITETKDIQKISSAILLNYIYTTQQSEAAQLKRAAIAQEYFDQYCDKELLKKEEEEKNRQMKMGYSNNN